LQNTGISNFKALGCWLPVKRQSAVRVIEMEEVILLETVHLHLTGLHVRFFIFAQFQQMFLF